MAANLTVTLDSAQIGPETGANGIIRERIKIVGAAAVANDTGTYTLNFVQRSPVATGSSLASSLSGSTLTVTDLLGIGSSTVYAYVEGYA
jgi:hypothetical protein